MKFEKYHGTGNDFIIIDSNDMFINDYSKLAIKICDRHFGVGADGLLVVDQSSKADIKMRIFNSDGTEASMCGNGIRCFSKYVYDNKIVTKEQFSVETLAGIMKPKVKVKNNQVNMVEVDLGEPNFKASQIPVDINEEFLLNKELVIKDKVYTISTVLLGTIHTVLFVSDLNKINHEEIGKLIEKHKWFPNRTNVNFVQVINQNKIDVITWEKGAGLTLACGTGAAASVLFGSLYHGLDHPVQVNLRGGTLEINQLENEHVIMTGGVELICKGDYKINI